MNIKLGVGLLLIIIALVGCSYLNKKLGLEDDNIVEELVEDIIEEELGISVDLTPEREKR